MKNSAMKTCIHVQGDLEPLRWTGNEMKKVPNKSEKPVHPTKIKQAVTKKNIEIKRQWPFSPLAIPFLWEVVSNALRIVQYIIYTNTIV